MGTPETLSTVSKIRNENKNGKAANILYTGIFQMHEGIIFTILIYSNSLNIKFLNETNYH
jgi:hypothetical protein